MSTPATNTDGANPSWFSQNKDSIFSALGGIGVGAGISMAGQGGQGGGGFFERLMFGTPSSTEKLDSMDPQQLELLKQMLGGLGGPLSQGLGNMSNILSGSQDSLQAFQAPMMRQFNEQIMPGIANRFSGMDAQGSSAFTNALGSAGAGLQENLSAQKSGLMQNSMQQLMGMMGQGLGAQPFAYAKHDAQDSPLAKILGIAAQAGMKMGGF